MEVGTVRLKYLGFLLGVSLLICSSAWANTLTFDFSDCSLISSAATKPATCPNGTATGPLTYTVGGLSITAVGYDIAGQSKTDRLYVKSEGVEEDEIGLGISDEQDHEINTTHFIQLDLQNLISDGVTSGILEIGSLSGDRYQYCLTNTAAAGSTTLSHCWTPSLGYGVLANPITVYWGLTRYLDVRAKTNNVLIESLEVDPVDPVPEPGSMLLLASGLLGAAGYMRRRVG